MGKHNFGHADDPSCGGILFQAATFAAATGHRFSGFHGHVPDLTGTTVFACDDFAVQHHPAADTGTQGNHDRTLAATAAALPQFTQRRNVGVIARGNMRDLWQQFVHVLLDVKDTPAKVHALIDREAVVHGAGHADPDANDLRG